MKIAIITWFENLNYGTVLQCFALQEYIKEAFNAQVDVIRYSPAPEHYLRNLRQKTEHVTYKISDKIKSVINKEDEKREALLSGEFAYEAEAKKASFERFLSGISFTERITSTQELRALESSYDAFICGSDQIWNPLNLNSNYYLNFVENKPKIAYAASFGISYLPEYSHKYIKDYTASFNAIGLRESSCRNELEALTSHNNISVVCDPTLLFEADFWRGLEAEKLRDKPYYTSYFLGDTSISKEAVACVGKLGIDNLILPATSYMISHCDRECIGYGPSEFIRAVDDAQFVLTDSFHAVCFSVIFKKSFCVIRKHKKNNPFNQNSRIESLLAILGLEDRIAEKACEATEILNREIDYNAVYEKLSAFSDKSKEFLCSGLKVIK